MPEETPERKYKIGEVCRKADVQPYVLRYWETEFPPLSPGKSGGGQRLYSEREVEIILRIKQLLYSEGFTIAGAKKKLEVEVADPERALIAETEALPAVKISQKRPATSKSQQTLLKIRQELSELLELLED